MSNVFERMYEKAVTDEKKMKIRTSEHGDEKIRSGQGFLYRKYGMNSEVIEIRLKENVSGSCLNRALSRAVKRYPYLNSSLVELEGDFYITRNDIAPLAVKSKNLRKLGSIQVTYHLIDITYYDKSIYISFHHALCDGRGIMPFIETLLLYYCQAAYKSTASGEGIRMENDPILEGEYDEPFREKYTVEDTEPLENIEEKISLTEDPDYEGDFKTEIIIDSESFMKTAKENGATPVILVSLLMSSVISKMYVGQSGSVVANIAVDIREQLGHINAFKNCVISIGVPFEAEMRGKSLAENAGFQRAYLNARRDKNYVRTQVNNSFALFDKLDEKSSYEEKQQLMSFFDGMLIPTYIISYVGGLVLNENVQYIDEIHAYNSGTQGMGLTMISAGDKFCIDIKQSFSTRRYVEGFSNELSNLGIRHEVRDTVSFETPADAVIKR